MMGTVKITAAGCKESKIEVPPGEYQEAFQKEGTWARRKYRHPKNDSAHKASLS